tara:strand:- start:93 stop:350 length:258 start_codon:yes stop_codon:yes gene_type:complete
VLYASFCPLRTLNLTHQAITDGVKKMGKEIKKLMKENNYELVRSKRHLIWKHRIFGGMITTPKTPSDWRALKNIQRDIRNQLRFA